MTLKVGVIGTGGIAQYAHLPSYHKIENVELVGIADINEKLAKKVAQRYKCNCYTDFKQLIDKNKLDAVSVCTPPFARQEIIQYATENNIAVLCEKPLANSYTNALAIKKIIEKSSVQFMMGFTFRFSDWYQNAFKLIQNGKLGEVIFSRGVYASQLPSYPWFFDKEKSGGGVIIDRGSQVIDLVTWLFGIPKKVHAVALNKRNMDVEENGFLTLTHENFVSQLTLSFGVNTPLDRFEIFGTASNLIIDHSLRICSFFPASTHILRYYTSEINKRAIRALLESKNLIKKKEDNPHFKEINYFIKCLNDGAEVTPNYLDGVINNKIIGACYTSINDGKVAVI